MKYSLSTKITIIFGIGLVVICALFITAYSTHSSRFMHTVQQNHYNAINWLVSMYHESSMPTNWEKYFKNFNLVYITNQTIKDEILKFGKIIDSSENELGTVNTILYNGNFYLNIKNESISIILKNIEDQRINDLLFVGFLSILITFVWFYVSILKNLSPLKKLRNDMKKFASGNMENLCRVYTKEIKNEVDEVAYEFNNAACKIKELLISRQLFLRTIMHELKTPIGKGRIISEMVENKMQKERLNNVFIRLDMLINEFAKIEQLLSKSYNLKYEYYHFSLILEQVIDIMMIDDFDKKVSIDIQEDMLLYVDFQLFSLAIKNLIDNALKYKEEDKIYVVCKENEICIKNLGKKLERPIEYYKQAFVREKNSVQTGFGLGLYIIESICDLHKFSFLYDYKDGYHNFFIRFNKNAKIKS